MLTIIKNKPVVKEKSNAYVIAVVILSLLSLTLLFLPVIVNIMNGFSTVNGADDKIYYLLRGLFGISIAISAGIFAVKKDVAIAAAPCFVGFITVLFPLYDSIASLVKAHKVAQQLSMSVGYGPYLINIGEYLLFTLLCIFTFLYSIGMFRNTLIITLISVISSMASLFTIIDKFITYDISTYEILSFGYVVFATLIPLVLILACDPIIKKNTKARYKARRMR